MMDEFQAYLGSLVEQETPQMCLLCGMFFKNALSFQYHMRAHSLYSGPTPEQLLSMKNLNLPGTSGSLLDASQFDGRNISIPALGSMISEAKPGENRSNPAVSSVNIPDFQLGLSHLPPGLLESQTFDPKSIAGPMPFDNKNVGGIMAFDSKNAAGPSSTFDAKSVAESLPFGSKSVDRTVSLDSKGDAGPLPFDNKSIERAIIFDNKSVERTMTFDTKSVSEPITTPSEVSDVKLGKSRNARTAPSVTDFPIGLSGLPTLPLNVLDVPIFRQKDAASTSTNSSVASTKASEMKSKNLPTDIPVPELCLPSLPTNALEALAFGSSAVHLPTSSISTALDTKFTDVQSKITTGSLFGTIPDFSMNVLAPQPNVIEHQTFGGREATVPVNSNMTEPKSAEITNKANTTEHIPEHYTMTPDMLEALISANKEAYKDVTMGLIDSKSDNKDTTSTSAQSSSLSMQSNPTGGIDFQGTQFFNSLTQQYLAPNTLTVSGSGNQNSFNGFQSSTSTQQSSKKFDLFDNTNTLDMINMDEFKHEPISSDDEIEELLNECKAMGERSMDQMQPDLLKTDIDTLSDISDIGEDRYTHLTDEHDENPHSNQHQSLTNDISELFKEDVPKLVPMVENSIVVSKPVVSASNETTSVIKPDLTCSTDTSTSTTSSIATISTCTTTTITTSSVSESKQDDKDNSDFSLDNIPQVGKFMKIKKYLQSYEHKRHEQKQSEKNDMSNKPSTSDKSGQSKSSDNASRAVSLNKDEKETLKQAIREITEKQKSYKSKTKSPKARPEISAPVSRNLRTRRQTAANARTPIVESPFQSSKKTDDASSEAGSTDQNAQKRKSEPQKVVVKSCKVVITDTIKKDGDLVKGKKEESPKKIKDDAAVSEDNIIKDSDKKEADRILTRNARNRPPQVQKVTPTATKRKSDEHRKVTPTKAENNSAKTVEKTAKHGDDSQMVTRRLVSPNSSVKKKCKTSPTPGKCEPVDTEIIHTRRSRKSNRSGEVRQQNCSDSLTEFDNVDLKSFISLQVEEVRKLREKSPSKSGSDVSGLKHEASINDAVKDVGKTDIATRSEQLVDETIETFSETASVRSVSMSNQEVQDNFDKIDELCKHRALVKDTDMAIDVTKDDKEFESNDDSYTEIIQTPLPLEKKQFVNSIFIRIPTEQRVYSSDESGYECNDSYVGHAVEPLKLKLFKIKPTKEKKHHKKKKKKDKKEKREKLKLKIKKDRLVEEEPVVIDPYSFSDNEDIAQGKKPKSYEKKHACEWCGQAFGQKCDLTKHVMIHTGERPWPCDTCDKRFQRKTDLVKHTRIHTGEKPYECEYCGKRVSDKSQLNVHRRLHTGDRPYSCDVCSKGCITSSELNRHRITHFNDRPWHCETCGKTFKLKDNLALHVKIHYGTKKFKCEVCHLGFDRLEKKERHMRLHESETPYMCRECGLEFAKLPLYANHIRCHKREHGPYTCAYCDRQFDCKSNLESHLRSHTKEKPFKCDVCGNVFSLKGNLKNHMKQHGEDKEKIYVCDKCPTASFRLKRELDAHKQQHSYEVDSLQCDLCGSMYPDQCALRDHWKSAHPHDAQEFDMDDSSYIMDIMDKELLKDSGNGGTGSRAENREKSATTGSVSSQPAVGEKMVNTALVDSLMDPRSSQAPSVTTMASNTSPSPDTDKHSPSVSTDGGKGNVGKKSSLEANYTHTLSLLMSPDKSSELVQGKNLLTGAKSSTKDGANLGIKRLLSEAKDSDVSHSEHFKSNNGVAGGAPVNDDNVDPPIKRSRKRQAQVPIYERKPTTESQFTGIPSYSWKDVTSFNASDYVNSLMNSMESTADLGLAGNDSIPKQASSMPESKTASVKFANVGMGQTSPDRGSAVKYAKVGRGNSISVSETKTEPIGKTTDCSRSVVNSGESNSNQNIMKSLFPNSQPDKQTLPPKFGLPGKLEPGSLQSYNFFNPQQPGTRSATGYPEKSDFPVSRSATNFTEKSDFPSFTNFASIPSLARNFQEFASAMTSDGFHSGESSDRRGQVDRGDDMASLLSHFDYPVNH